MYAVVKTGGKQYRVEEGQTLKIEKLTAEQGASVNFSEVLMIVDGSESIVGNPYIDGGMVTATVKSHGRDRKIKVIKFRRRKHHRKQMGHRQYHTEIQITGIAAQSLAQHQED
jgi:large subunit ribosomal protein L21